MSPNAFAKWSSTEANTSALAFPVEEEDFQLEVIGEDGEDVLEVKLVECEFKLWFVLDVGEAGGVGLWDLTFCNPGSVFIRIIAGKLDEAFETGTLRIGGVWRGDDDGEWSTDVCWVKLIAIVDDCGCCCKGCGDAVLEVDVLNIGFWVGLLNLMPEIAAGDWGDVNGVIAINEEVFCKPIGGWCFACIFGLTINGKGGELGEVVTFIWLIKPAGDNNTLLVFDVWFWCAWWGFCWLPCCKVAG